MNSRHSERTSHRSAPSPEEGFQREQCRSVSPASRPSSQKLTRSKFSRLVSNVLITFLNTPRADTKRFEMLSLLSSILSWSDDQRETVGLQRSSGLSAPGVVASGSRTHKGHARSGKGKAVDDGLGENEVSLSLLLPNRADEFRRLSRRCGSNSYSKKCKVTARQHRLRLPRRIASPHFRIQLLQAQRRIDSISRNWIYRRFRHYECRRGGQVY